MDRNGETRTGAPLKFCRRIRAEILGFSGKKSLMMRNVKHIKIYRRYDDTKEWVADCFVSLDGHPHIHDCVPDLCKNVKEVIEEHLPSVKGQIWLAGEIPVSEETYGWVSEDILQELKERT